MYALHTYFFPLPQGSCHVNQFIFHILLRSLKYAISFIYHTHDEFDSADPSSKNAGRLSHLNLVKWLSVSSCSSVDRAPTWWLKSYGFDSCQGLRIFLCATLMSCLSIHVSHFINKLKIHHLYSLNNHPIF